MISSAVLIATIAMAFSLSSCAFKNGADDNKHIRDASGNNSETLSREEISVVLIPVDEQLGLYTAKFSWPVGKRVLVSFSYDKRISSRDSIKIVENSFDGEAYSSFEVPCPSRTDINPKISVNSKAVGKVATYSYEIACPVDFEIVGEGGNLTKILGELNGRLFLRNNAILKLKSSQLKLNLIGLHIEGNATIESDFDPKAAEPQVQIVAKQASGHLTLRLNGYDGRDGISGDERAQASNEYQKKLRDNAPADGIDGKDGTESVTAVYFPGISIGGPREERVCTLEPTNGGSGAAGTIKGLDGSDGEDGSPAPKALIKIEDASQLQLTANVSPGRGGKFGARGLGQRGGRGGRAGHRPVSCSAAKRGADGANALPGEDGIPGKNGTCGQIEISANLKSVMRVIDQHDFSKCAQDPNLIRIVP